ncbi:hypothetical protein HDU98_010579 [Podochytrium sp. JEL0797]|nr:hypothetical protein HDU98_010579 [Podochytrium sp. JEL0797]
MTQSCCRRAESCVEVLQEKLEAALEEINLLRGLLHLPRLKDITLGTPGRTVASKQTCPPSLEYVPTEVLNQIASYLPATSFIALCHALPALKYASEMLHAVGVSLNVNVTSMFPDFTVPNHIQKIERPNLIQLVNVHALSRLLPRFGGVFRIRIRSIQFLDSILPLLTKTVDLIAPDESPSYRGEDSVHAILTHAIQSGLKIRSLEIPFGISAKPVLECCNLYGFRKLRCSRHLFPFEALQDNHAIRELALEMGFPTAPETVARELERLRLVLPSTGLRIVLFRYECCPDGGVVSLFRVGEGLTRVGWSKQVVTGGPVGRKTCVVEWRREK